jgi:NDP-sugar pyrophosphorylase family protein
MVGAAAGVPTTAAILAGGLGTRLRSVVSNRPKVLAEVAGRPFLYWLLDPLAKLGIRRVVLCTGYLADQVSRELGVEYQGIDLEYSEEIEPLGTGGAIRLGLPHIQGSPVLVLNGDSWTGADLRRLCARHAATRARGTLLLTRVSDGSRFGRVSTDRVGAVTRFVEKDGRTAPAWINTGVYVLDRELIEAIPTGRAVSMEREVLPEWIGRGLTAARTRTPFIDIGVPESLALAQSLFGTAPPRTAASSAISAFQTKT